MCRKINLSAIGAKNAHRWLYENGCSSYIYLGENNPDRNLLASRFSEGPNQEHDFRRWLWKKIKDENIGIHSALCEMFGSVTIILNDKQSDQKGEQVADIIEKAVKYYREHGLRGKILCRRCYCYLNDWNAAESHMCKDCVYGGEDEGEDQAYLHFFCDVCKVRLVHWTDQLHGDCKPCRASEEARALARWS